MNGEHDRNVYTDDPIFGDADAGDFSELQHIYSVRVGLSYKF